MNYSSRLSIPLRASALNAFNPCQAPITHLLHVLANLLIYSFGSSKASQPYHWMGISCPHTIVFLAIGGSLISRLTPSHALLASFSLSLQCRLALPTNTQRWGLSFTSQSFVSSHFSMTDFAASFKCLCQVLVLVVRGTKALISSM